MSGNSKSGKAAVKTWEAKRQAREEAIDEASNPIYCISTSLER